MTLKERMETAEESEWLTAGLSKRQIKKIQRVALLFACIESLWTRITAKWSKK